jgi:hypothetical protein
MERFTMISGCGEHVIETIRLVAVPRIGTRWLFRMLIFFGMRRLILVQPLKWILLRDVD